MIKNLTYVLFFPLLWGAVCLSTNDNAKEVKPVNIVSCEIVRIGDGDPANDIQNQVLEHLRVDLCFIPASKLKEHFTLLQMFPDIDNLTFKEKDIYCVCRAYLKPGGPVDLAQATFIVEDEVLNEIGMKKICLGNVSDGGTTGEMQAFVSVGRVFGFRRFSFNKKSLDKLSKKKKIKLRPESVDLKGIFDNYGVGSKNSDKDSER